MGRPRVVVEYATCARDLPHGGVFVPGLKLAELAECELVVRTPAQELALVARAVMVTPHGCGLELVGFNADVRAKLAELAVAASRRPSTPPPVRAAASPRQSPTPTRPPGPRVTPQNNPAVPLGPPERPTPTPLGRAPTPPPVPRQASIQKAVAPPDDDDEPEISVEREIEAEPPDEETDARRAALRARLQTAPSAEVPSFAEVPDDDDDLAPPPLPAPPSDEPNFAEVPDEETTGGGDELPPIDTAVRKRADDDHGGDTAIRKLAPDDDEHDDHGGDTALTKLPPDHDRGDHGGDTAIRKLAPDDELAPSDTKVGKPADLFGSDEPAIVPSTFEPVALEEHTPRPQRPPRPEPRPEKTIPVSDYPENRWGRIDLDDNMPRMEVRDKNSGPSLDLDAPLDLLELADGPPAKPAAADAEPPTTQTPALDAEPEEPTSDEPQSEEENKIAKNVHERLRGLNLAQQVKLAQTGETHERMVLERMYGKTVWEALLRNPRLTGPEVARIARMGQLPRPLIEVIVNNGGWLQIPEVRRALLSNPRLGTDQILRVLRLLPKPELKLAAMQTSYPSPVRDAARKLAKELQK